MKVINEIKNGMPPPRVFRKRFGKETWHWSRCCSNYPLDNFEEVHLATEPEGDFCNECSKFEMAARLGSGASQSAAFGLSKPLRYYLF